MESILVISNRKTHACLAKNTRCCLLASTGSWCQHLWCLPKSQILDPLYKIVYDLHVVSMHASANTINNFYLLVAPNAVSMLCKY